MGSAGSGRTPRRPSLPARECAAIGPQVIDQHVLGRLLLAARAVLAAAAFGQPRSCQLAARQHVPLYRLLSTKVSSSTGAWPWRPASRAPTVVRPGPARGRPGAARPPRAGSGPGGARGLAPADPLVALFDPPSRRAEARATQPALGAADQVERGRDRGRLWPRADLDRLARGRSAELGPDHQGIRFSGR